MLEFTPWLGNKRFFEMVTRRYGREWALQLLVQFDFDRPESPAAAMAAFWTQQADLEAEDLAADKRGAKAIFTSTDPKVLTELAAIRDFAEERVNGVWAERDALDAQIEPFLENWSLYRLGVIERNVLRLGAWELLKSDIHPAIVINEAVDLAKFFSSTKAGRFVNGILDRFAKKVRAERDHKQEKEVETFTP